MGIIFNDDVPGHVVALIILVFVFIGSLIGMAIGTTIDIQLANAICEEHYGTELSYIDKGELGFNVHKVVCKEKVSKKERYDGLIVTIGD